MHFFALLLWVAAVLAFVGRMPQLGWAIIAVVVVNGAFSFVQEYRAERATRALAALLPEAARVLRDGRKAQVPAGELVPGDVVLLREGDRVSVDARVLRSDDLKVDNAALTGESEPVPRNVEALAAAPSDPAEAPNLVFAGTYVTSGSGRAVVVATGARTRLGGISRLTEVSRRPTPLRIDLDRSVRTIGAFALATGVVFFGVSLALGTPAKAGFLFAIGVIVALVPEGLLPTLTLSLAMSATRMARRGALVRHLEAVETLGSTTVICSDKTGHDDRQPDDRPHARSRSPVVTTACRGSATTPPERSLSGSGRWPPASSPSWRTCCARPRSATTPAWSGATAAGVASATPPRARSWCWPPRAA